MRQEEGYCCIVYMQCSSTTFRINNGGIAAFTQAKVATNCSEDYIGIEGKIISVAYLDILNYLFSMKQLATLYDLLISGGMQAYGQMQNRFCGGYLNNVDTATTDAKIRGKIL